MRWGLVLRISAPSLPACGSGSNKIRWISNLWIVGKDLEAVIKRKRCKANYWALHQAARGYGTI
ncbi:MAG TPA: hypothetical protein DCP63_06020 [Bacteroidetes bacterium]|nr:hypothetical protein [Bacteroidota bacterium]